MDFFAAFAGQGFPTKFWCLFIGMPLLALGMICFKAGFLRKITGYVAGEAAPAVRDTVEYVAEGLKPHLRSAPEDGSLDRSPKAPAERIRQLEELKKQGMISESEYALKREEILRQL